LTVSISRLNFFVTLASFPELKKLPKRQRFQLAEELWLSGIADSLPVRSAQKMLFDRRWAPYQSGAAKRITLAELERCVSRK
jgi:putative addiction module component (TIGR02574 family)